MVRVIPVGILRQYVGGQQELLLSDWAGRPVRELLEQVEIPSVLVGAVLINGQLVSKDELLREADEVKLIPLIGGG